MSSKRKHKHIWKIFCFSSLGDKIFACTKGLCAEEKHIRIVKGQRRVKYLYVHKRKEKK
jgi:hypothetical protein